MRSGSTMRRSRRSPTACSPPPKRDAVAALAARRLAREPVARIVGHKEFWGLPFELNADTLVPRPETETVVEAALAALDARRSRTRRCASPISAPARARCCWRCSRELPAAPASAPISASPRSTAPAQCRGARPCRPRSVRGLRLRRGARGRRSISSSPIRPMSRAATSRRLQPEVRDFDPAPCARRRPRWP